MIDIKRLAFDKSLNQTKLGEILRLPQPEVSKIMNGRRDITQAHIDLLTEHFGQDTIAQYIIPDDALEMMQKPTSRSIQASIIPAEVIEEVKAEIEEAESVPVVPEVIASKTNLNIREYIEENEDELEHINPSKLLQNADLAERILGTSMLPDFAPGDIVFARFLSNKAKIIDGKTYYFDLKTHPTMIRIVKIEGDKLRLTALHPNFGDIVINKSDVINVGKIIGLLRTTFGSQYAEIESLREKKEKQIESLISEVNKAGVRIDTIMAQNALLLKKLLEK